MQLKNEGSYDDIINLPHPRSSRHAPMSRENRAAQFSPFAALTGYGEAVSETARFTEERCELDEQAKAMLDERLQLLRELLELRPEVDITYFIRDSLKSGGEYRSRSGRLLRIDPLEGSIFLEDGFKLAIEDIYDIDSPLFNTL